MPCKHQALHLLLSSWHFSFLACCTVHVLLFGIAYRQIKFKQFLDAHAGASGAGRLSDSSGTSAYLNHKARFMQSRKPSGKGPLNPILSSFAEEDSDSEEDNRAIQGLMGRTPTAAATAARLPRQPRRAPTTALPQDVGSVQAMRDAQQSLLDTWVDDMPSVPVLAHLKRKLSKS